MCFKYVNYKSEKYIWSVILSFSSPICIPFHNMHSVKKALTDFIYLLLFCSVEPFGCCWSFLGSIRLFNFIHNFEWAKEREWSYTFFSAMNIAFQQFEVLDARYIFPLFTLFIYYLFLSLQFADVESVAAVLLIVDLWFALNAKWLARCNSIIDFAFCILWRIVKHF